MGRQTDMLRSSFLVVLFALVVVSNAKTKISGMTAQDFDEMKIKELKKLLSERNKACQGCTEKREYVERLVEIAEDEEDEIEEEESEQGGVDPKKINADVK